MHAYRIPTILLIHMVGGWMGRVSMCNETLLDECYLCLLAQVSFILEFFFGMAAPLAPVDLDLLQQEAVRWALENPGVHLEDLTSPVRRGSKGARALFSVLTAAANSAGRAVGAQPCDSCGRWTSCWCEGCEGGLGPPTAICTSCDHAEIICRACGDAGRTWASSQAQATQGTIQVRGFVLSTGEWCPVSPPLEVTFEEVEGFEGETLEERVAAWAQATHDATQDGSRA